MQYRHAISTYLRERQPPAVRFFHIAILFLVLSQILVSNFMEFTNSGEISRNFIEFYATWIHIISGLTLIPLSLIFITIELKRHGLRYFLPYLYGEFSQLKDDLQTLLRLNLPDANAYGIAAIIQGLGLGALLLVALSGSAWFLSWLYVPTWAHNLKEIHETLTGLIEAYAIGHGGMGVLHLFFYLKNKTGH